MEDNTKDTQTNYVTEKDLTELKVAFNRSFKELIRLHQDLKARVVALEPKPKLAIESPNTAAARAYETSSEIQNLKSISRNKDLDPQYITRAKDRLWELGVDPEEE